MIPETRGLAIVLVAALEATAIYVGVRAERRSLVAIGVALAALQLAGTVAASPERAHATIIFAGDGGAMVLGTLLAAAFAWPPARRGALRWGLLVIGAAAFVDVFGTWWTARTDPDVIPFGEIEGVGLSDPSQLTETLGWSTHAMVARYVALGVACLVALAAVYAAGVYTARKRARS
jgi:hypothetical protein